MSEPTPTPPAIDPDATYQQKDVAMMFGLTQRQLRNEYRRGRLGAPFRLGRRPSFKGQTILAWRERLARPQPGTPTPEKLEPLHVYGLAELARALGVTEYDVERWGRRPRHQLPAPDFIDGRPHWSGQVILDWFAQQAAHPPRSHERSAFDDLPRRPWQRPA